MQQQYWYAWMIVSTGTKIWYAVPGDPPMFPLHYLTTDNEENPLLGRTAFPTPQFLCFLRADATAYVAAHPGTQAIVGCYTHPVMNGWRVLDGDRELMRTLDYDEAQACAAETGAHVEWVMCRTNIGPSVSVSCWTCPPVPTTVIYRHELCSET